MTAQQIYEHCRQNEHCNEKKYEACRICIEYNLSFNFNGSAVSAIDAQLREKGYELYDVEEELECMR